MHPIHLRPRFTLLVLIALFALGVQAPAALAAPPVAVDDAITVKTGTTISVYVLDNDTDADGDFLELTAPSGDLETDHGTVNCDSFGSCSYTSDAGYMGPDAFDYTVSDGNGGTDTANVAITVLANTPPVANDDSAARADEVVLGVLQNDQDDDGDEFNITAVTAPSFGTATINDGGEGGEDTITYAQTSNFGANDSFTYTIADTSGGSDTATVTLEHCPAVASSLDHGGLAVSERWAMCSATRANAAVGPTTTVFPPLNDSSLLLTSGDAAEAPGPNDSSGAGAGNDTEARGAFDPSILRLDLTVPAGANCLSFDFAFQSEEYPEYVNQGFNDGFLAELDVSDWSVGENSEITAPHNFAFDSTGAIVSVNSSFFEPGRVIEATGSQYDGSTPLLSVRTPVTPGPHVLYLSIFDAGDHALDSGAFVDNLKASPAGAGGCAAGANEPPNAVNNTLTTAEDTPSAPLNVLANDSDPDGHALTVTTLNPSAAHGDVSCTAAGLCTYTPDANYFGPDSFTYAISDGHGGTDTATVSITVTPVNDPPNAANDSLTTAQGTPGNVNVLANDSDVEGDSLTVTTLNPTAGHGSVSCTAAGVCTYTPSAGYSGPDSFEYTISDGHGGTDTATVSVTVTPSGANNPPVADDETLTTTEDTPGDVNVLAGDTDPDGDTLSVTTLAPSAAHGTVACTAGGVCTYTPNADYNGPDGFDYTVSDGKGGTDTGHVSITVTPVNDPPNAVNDALTTAEDTPSAPLNVLANDSDPDGHPLTVTTPNPSAPHGDVSCTTAGLCTYTPDANYFGPDSFTYAISDGHGGTDTATVSITVTPVNDPPNAVNNSLTTEEDVAKSLNVLANDTDPDGDSLSVSTLSPSAAHGTVACTAAGSCTYTPSAGYSGPDSFEYTISDGHGGTDTATVSITVTPADTNTPPSCAKVKPSKTKLWPPRHKFVTIALSGATDADGDKLTFSITAVTQDERVTKAISKSDKGPDAKRVPGKPNQIALRVERIGDRNGRVYRIHYTVSDGQGGTCSGIEKVGVPIYKGGPAIDNTGKKYNSFG